MENEIIFLKKQLTLLWRAVYVLVIIIGLFFLYSLANLGRSSDNRVSELEVKVSQLQLDKDNLKANQANLFHNDSVIVSNQKRMQDGQRVTSFASFLAKMLL